MRISPKGRFGDLAAVFAKLAKRPLLSRQFTIKVCTQILSEFQPSLVSANPKVVVRDFSALQIECRQRGLEVEEF